MMYDGVEAAAKEAACYWLRSVARQTAPTVCIDAMTEYRHRRRHLKQAAIARKWSNSGKSFVSVVAGPSIGLAWVAAAVSMPFDYPES